MLSKPTTFVIGAGASVEFGLPDGPALAANICKSLDIRFDGRDMLSGDPQIAETLRNASQRVVDGMPLWQVACWRIREGLPLANSIDNFMDNHRSDAEVQLAGRVAIVKSILEAEHKSKLRPAQSGRSEFNLANASDVWIHRLFQFLQEGRSKESVDGFFANCRFIIFNYDRCIERFLSQALVRHYSIDARKADQLVAAADILHVYGSVGELPGQSAVNGQVVDFGDTEVRLDTLTSRISTYADPSRAASMLPKIREYIFGAELLVFLGFAFHPMNLELLAPMNAEASGTPPFVLATAYSRSQFDADNIQRRLTQLFRRRGSDAYTIVDRSMTCSRLLSDYSTAFIG